MNKEVDNNVTERKKGKTLRELWEEAYGREKRRDRDFYFDEDSDEEKEKDWYD